MKHKIYKFLTWLIIGLFLFNPILSFSQSADEENRQVQEINKEIQAKRDRIKKMQEQQEIYSQAIAQKQKEKASLSNQLAILENRMAKAALDIESAQTEIDRTNLQEEKVLVEIKNKEEQIIKQKGQISTALKLIHRQDKKSLLEILLLNGTFNEFVSYEKNLEDVNKEISKNLKEVKEKKRELEEKKVNLANIKKELNELKAKLEDKKNNLASEQQNKTYILDQTKSSEKEYLRLLKLAKQEQSQAEADIVSLEKTVRERLAKISGQELKFNDLGFIWPIVKNTITAYFHDPDYPFRYVFEHPAIDIRAGQGSNVKAAASGYVAIAKDAGRGYSYIMIIHGNGLATVYGHVSKIFVKTDEYVVQGQSIGLSGGMPGTNGAGRLTTGPHLHFEIRLNGVPVDPLEYLP